MVVARKTPVAPAPPTSRSNSSQPLQRAVKAKSIPTPAPPSSGKETSSHSKLKNKNNSKPSNQKKTPAPTSSCFSQRIFLLLLSVFSIYALTVCRTDYTLSSPVCRSLAIYRTRVLEPYIVPPIQTYLVPPIHSAVHHPALAPLHPYVHSASAAIRPRAFAALKLAETTYETRVAPATAKFWGHSVLPVYYTRVHPHVRPYILYFNQHIVPFYKSAVNKLYTTYTHVLPYIERAEPYARTAIKTTYRYIITIYGKSKPHVLAAYARVKPHALALVHKARVQSVLLLAKAGDARREFVDPHVRRIWDKVKVVETSTSAEPAKSFPTPSVPEPSPELDSQLAASVIAAASSSLAAAAAESPSSSELLPPITPSSPADATAAAASSTAASSSSEAAASPVDTPPPTSAHAPTPSPADEPVPSSETIASASSIIAASLHAPSGILPVASAQTPTSPPTEDVDDFLREIGLDETANAREEPVPTPAAQAPSDGPNEAERLVLTAQKRADIVGRHTAWQARLDALVVEREGAFRAMLDGFRKGAVKELGDKYGAAAEGGVVGAVEAEAGKLMKGLEGYLQKLQGRGELTSAEREKEREKWAKVVEKVEERLAEKVRDVQGEVHQWYMGVREGEGREVLRAASEVKSFAEKAQADIGLDYAWLDDVTYQDWQKYHDLMRTSERFTTTLETIQNSTHSSPPHDVLVPALDTLEAEMQDVISRFLLRLQATAREAKEHVFAPVPPRNNEDDATKEPRVSILPIEPSGAPRKQGDFDTEHLFVGKDPEEVKRVLESVKVETTAGDHVEL